MIKWLGEFFENPYNAEMRERIESRFAIEEECRFMHGFPIEKKDRDISKATHYKEVGERCCKILIKNIDSLDFELGVSDLIYVDYFDSNNEWHRLALLGSELGNIKPIY